MFIIDSNELITAKNTYYGFDFAPGFWEWLDSSANRGVLGSIEAVRDELLQGTDELSDWAQRRPNFFAPLKTGIGDAGASGASIPLRSRYRRLSVGDR
ncbi:DUF4411 family protein [Corynebacterium falsenii]|uniref:DUF4411 family protein n=1 Tax=Corynebacterium falsenii TaxID=108486 RepID=UPI003FD2495B